MSNREKAEKWLSLATSTNEMPEARKRASIIALTHAVLALSDPERDEEEEFFMPSAEHAAWAAQQGDYSE